MTRTIQERFLLMPTDEARLLVLGVIARALAMYPTVAVYAFSVLSNHYHLLASSSDGWSLPRFIGYINSNIALELGRLHGWDGKFWGDRASVIEVVDDDAVVARMQYIIAQGVKEGLVACAQDWTGASSTPALLGDMTLRGIWVNRDRQTRAARRVKPSEECFDEELTLRLTPIPQWAHLGADELRAKHEALVAGVNATAASARTTPALGMRAVLAQDPHDAPAQSKHSRRPLCHASTVELRRWFRAEFRSFVAAFRAATDAVKSTATALFPRFPLHSFPRPLVYVDQPATPVAGAPDGQRPPGHPPRALLPALSGG